MHLYQNVNEEQEAKGMGDLDDLRDECDERDKRKSRRSMAIGGIVSLLLVLLLASITSFSTAQPHKRNLVFMISDGFGPASATFARNYQTFDQGLSYNHTLNLDSILDSAAGATAFSCALKTYNGAIGVDPSQQPCGTILEAAKLAGYTTGLVVTSRITHATPASFAAHVPDRNMEDQIAQHEIGNYSLGRMVDLLFGGGACHFLSKSTTGSCRADDINVAELAREGGWTVQTNIDDFNALTENAKLPLMHLFTADHMSYEIDRQEGVEPSLREMVEKAISILENATKDTDKGHTNDAAAHVHEILAYDDVIGYIKSVVDKTSNTIMISVSDHETGGLSVASQSNESTYPEYLWKPSALQDVTNSTEVIAAYLISEGLVANQAFLRETALSKWLGIHDATVDEVELITGVMSQNLLAGRLAKLVNVRAQLGWATHGHSAVDYVYGAGSEKLKGNVENTDIGKFMEGYLGVSLLNVTAKLRRSEQLWDESVDYSLLTEGLLHYHTLDVDAVVDNE